ncbi:MAG: hypothetical protein R2867_17535 [Caldilineaceae bacterium]
MNSENQSNDFANLPREPRAYSQSQSARCDDIDPLIPAHSIGATDADEAAQINARLAECPRTADELALQ